MHGHGEKPVAACGAWTAEDTFEVRICSPEGVFCPVVRFHYAGGELHMDLEPNVSWGPTTAATVIGRLAG
jgi:hypothetical protein